MNPRPLGPEPSALPTALHPGKKNRSSQAAAVWLGMRGSNSHGRSQSPLHYHYANPHRVCVSGVCPQRSYIIACPAGFVNAFFKKNSNFLKNLYPPCTAFFSAFMDICLQMGYTVFHREGCLWYRSISSPGF